MKRLLCLIFVIVFSSKNFAQLRNVNKLTLETTYSYAEIHKTLKDLIDQADRSSYFDDTFFNELLKKIVQDKQFTDKEKVQLFYLMQKKLGFSFVGINYLPPKQTYFSFFKGEVFTWQKTKASLKELNYDPTGFLVLLDSSCKKDAIVASNALLLATLLNEEKAAKKLEYYSQSEVILACKNPDIINHYVCLSSAIKQTEGITANLIKNLLSFKTETYIEDIICALYTRNSPVGSIGDYILQEQNQKNDLSIQTALCALAAKVPQATFEKSLKNFADQSKEKWKKELLKSMVAKKVPFNYSLASSDQIVTKTWETVALSQYVEGVLISNAELLEFDPN